MADLIDRAALDKDIEETVRFSVKEGVAFAEMRGANKITDRIKAAPAVDAVKVVRCKKCIHAQWSKKNKAYYCKRRWALHKVRERDFCSYGVRRKDI